MGRIEVQGIVSAKTNKPLVQFRQIDDDEKLIVGWQSGVMEAREMSQQIVEAASNAVYDAALIAWIKEMWPDDEWEEIAAKMLPIIRTYRADAWGLPDQPDDWR